MAPETAIEDEAFEPGKQLPRGRHGLPREKVTESQRARIIQAMIDSVAERGYQETRVVDVVEGAGVSRATFYDLFDDMEDCFLATYDHVSARLFEAASAAYDARSDAQWAARIRAGMAAFLKLLAQWPEGARLAIVEVLAAGPKALVRRDAVLRQLAELVDAGRSESSLELPGFTSIGIVGGIEELLYSEVLHGATARLPARLPDIVYWITQPFVGAEAAAAERERARESLSEG
ncbi:MAG TPA: TetR/AcrR family transcriptional regulator [Solirubrobacterales bacterium]